jgi:hypothetical protein
MSPLLCARCPLCDHEPRLVVSPEQAFCGNDDCTAFCWNMTMSRQWNLDKITEHNITAWADSPLREEQ